MGPVGCRPVGSKGSKPRKPQHSQHLPKVGTKPDMERELHEERKGVVDAIGLGGAPSWLKYLVIAIGVVLLVASLWAWIF